MLLTFFKSRIGLSLSFLVIGIVLGFITYAKQYPSTTTVQTLTHTKTITVEKPVLTDRIVTKLIVDPNVKQAASRLIKENEALKIDVTQLATSLALAQSIGGTSQGGVITTPITSEVDTTSEFNDYQLSARYTTKTFSYVLAQQFVIVSTVGRDKEGKPVGLTGLFQKTPEGLTNIPVETTNIFTDQAIPHWILSPRLQVGASQLMTDGTGAIVALQWLKKGKSTANEEIPVAILSPALFFNKNVKDIGLLPISFNIGSVKHVPLTNVWLSPFISKSRVGVAISATF